MRPADLLVAVDGKPVADAGEAHAVLGGPAGAPVVLRVRRGAEELELTLTRRVVQSSVSSARMLPGGVGYMRIPGFHSPESGEAPAQQEYDLLNGLLEQDLGSLLIDLRFNPGGDLADLPLAVLVNGHSMSASEILAAAVQDHGRGLVFGSRTFGKGSGQSYHRLREGSLGITIAVWRTPLGRSLQRSVEQRGGVQPDVEVPMTPEEEEALLRQLVMDRLGAADPRSRVPDEALDRAAAYLAGGV